jgi:hypothetical protein
VGSARLLSGLERSDPNVFESKDASPTCAASGKYQEQLIGEFDEALERFGAKRQKQCLQKFSGYISLGLAASA